MYFDQHIYDYKEVTGPKYLSEGTYDDLVRSMNDFTKEAFSRHAKNLEDEGNTQDSMYGNMDRRECSNIQSSILSPTEYFHSVPPTFGINNHAIHTVTTGDSISEHGCMRVQETHERESRGKVNPNQKIPLKQEESSTVDSSLENIKELGLYADCTDYRTQVPEMKLGNVQVEQVNQTMNYEMTNYNQGYKGNAMPEMPQNYYYNMMPYKHPQVYNQGDIYPTFNGQIDVNNEGIQSLNSQSPVFDNFLAGDRYRNHSPVRSGRGDSRNSPVICSRFIPSNGNVMPDLSIPTWLPTPTPDTESSIRLSEVGSPHQFRTNSPLMFAHDAFMLHMNDMANRNVTIKDNLIANGINIQDKKRLRSPTPTVGRPRLNRNNYSCANCRVKTTPQWRYVNGIAVCNACYMRIRKDKSRMAQMGGKSIKKSDS